MLGAFHEIRQRSKKSYVMLHTTVALVGIGSMLFHGTLTAWGQQMDELPMVWHLLTAMDCLNNNAIDSSGAKKRSYSGLLLVYAIIFSVGHLILKTTTAFQIHFGVLIGTALIRMYTRFCNVDAGQNGQDIIALFVASGLCGFAFWLLDYNYCDFVSRLPINPHGHMLWHIGMGYCAYSSVVMLKVFESAEAGKMVDIKYYFGLPFAYRATGTIDVITADIQKK